MFDKLFGFVGPVLKTVSGGLKNVQEVADENPKSSGILAIIMVSLGYDPTVIANFLLNAAKMFGAM